MTDGRMMQKWSLFSKLGRQALDCREAAHLLFDQEAEALEGLSREEREQVPELSTWAERKRLYVQIRRLKRIRNAIRRQVYGFGEWREAVASAGELLRTAA